MVAIVTKATLSLKNLVAKDDGKEESRHDLCNTTYPSIVHTQLHLENEQKKNILAHIILLSGPISELRSTERQKCIDAGRQGSFLLHAQAVR